MWRSVRPKIIPHHLSKDGNLELEHDGTSQMRPNNLMEQLKRRLVRKKNLFGVLKVR